MQSAGSSREPAGRERESMRKAATVERGHARAGVCVSKLNSFSSRGKLDRLKLISNSRSGFSYAVKFLKLVIVIHVGECCGGI